MKSALLTSTSLGGRGTLPPIDIAAEIARPRDIVSEVLSSPSVVLTDDAPLNVTVPGFGQEPRTLTVDQARRDPLWFGEKIEQVLTPEEITKAHAYLRGILGGRYPHETELELDLGHVAVAYAALDAFVTGGTLTIERA
jgi:hypothetical protein